MKESRSVEARRRQALPYYNVKRRRQKEREREAERSRRRREEQQDADREREAERGRRRREEQDREREAERSRRRRDGEGGREQDADQRRTSAKVYLGPMTTVCHHHGNTIIEVLWEEHCRGITVVGGPSPLCGGYSLVMYNYNNLVMCTVKSC